MLIMFEQPSPLTETSQWLLSTFRKLIKPMVRLFLAKGITYPLLLEEIKRTFVQVAEEEFALQGKSQTDSRITLLTGVHRRDVHRIRTEQTTETKSRANFSAQVIAQWVGNPRYLDASGKPKPLPRSRRLGNDDSFESLVASVSKDIRARPVLDEWCRTGIVSLSEEDEVQLNIEAFIPKDNLEEQLFFLGMNVHDHLAAAVNNTLNYEKLFERCVYYDNLTLEEIEALHRWIQSEGMAFLTQFNKLAMADGQARDSRTPTFRMNTGLYFYYEPSAEAMLTEQPSPDPATQKKASDGL